METQEKDSDREVPLNKAKYAVILRANMSDTSVCFYDSLEDLKWAMLNSWFDVKEATPVKILEKQITLTE